MTITKEERERVAELLDLTVPDWRSLKAADETTGDTASVLLCIDDIDRVAQALRDAEAKATDLAQGVMDLLAGKPRDKPEPLLAGLTGAITTALRAGANAVVRQAPQWREVTETEPAIGAEVLLGNPTGVAVGLRDDLNDQRAWIVNGLRIIDHSREWSWMPLPIPPQPKPGPAPAPQSTAQPRASEAARIEALERTVAELAQTVARLERLSGGAK